MKLKHYTTKKLNTKVNSNARNEVRKIYTAH